MTATILPFTGTLVRVPPQPAKPLPIIPPVDHALSRERSRLENKHCIRTDTGGRVYVSEVFRDGAALLARCWSSGSCVDVQSFRLEVRR